MAMDEQRMQQFMAAQGMQGEAEGGEPVEGFEEGATEENIDSEASQIPAEEDQLSPVSPEGEGTAPFEDIPTIEQSIENVLRFLDSVTQRDLNLDVQSKAILALSQSIKTLTEASVKPQEVEQSAQQGPSPEEIQMEMEKHQAELQMQREKHEMEMKHQEQQQAMKEYEMEMKIRMQNKQMQMDTMKKEADAELEHQDKMLSMEHKQEQHEKSLETADKDNERKDKEVNKSTP